MQSQKQEQIDILNKQKKEVVEKLKCINEQLEHAEYLMDNSAKILQSRDQFFIKEEDILKKLSTNIVELYNCFLISENFDEFKFLAKKLIPLLQYICNNQKNKNASSKYKTAEQENILSEILEKLTKIQSILLDEKDPLIIKDSIVDYLNYDITIQKKLLQSVVNLPKEYDFYIKNIQKIIHSCEEIIDKLDTFHISPSTISTILSEEREKELNSKFNNKFSSLMKDFFQSKQQDSDTYIDQLKTTLSLASDVELLTQGYKFTYAGYNFTYDILQKTLNEKTNLEDKLNEINNELHNLGEKFDAMDEAGM